MKLIHLLKHYTPIVCVLLVGGSLSIFTQNHLSREVTEQRLTEFEMLISSFTIRLQDEILLEEAELETLSATINAYPKIIQSRNFDLLAQQIMNSVPAIVRFKVVIPSDNENGALIDIPGQLPGYYQSTYEYPESDGITITPSDTISKSFRPLNITGDDNKPGYLITSINIDSAMSKILLELIPDWLDIVIYSKNNNELRPFYYYSNTAQDLSKAPPAPLKIDNPFAIYLPGSVTTNDSALSLLYLPNDNTYFQDRDLTHWIPLIAGLLVTLIAGIYLHNLLRRNERVEKIIETRTKELTQAYRSLQDEADKRKDLLEQLTESESELRAVINSVDGLFWEKDLRSGRFSYISEQVNQIMGYSVSEVLSNPDLVPSRLPPEHRQMLESAHASVTAETGTFQLEMQFQRADDRIIWIRTIHTPIIENGKAVKIRGVTLDVTKYKKMGEERAKLHENLAQSQQELTSLVNSVDGVLWEFINGPYQYTYVSSQVEHILECSVNDLLENPHYIRERIDKDDLERVDREIESILDDGVKSRAVEFNMVIDTGKTLHIRNIFTPVIEDGRITKYRGVLLDITREKEMQEEHDQLATQLRQAQKLEAIGQLAAGIAHEINTPTQFVGDNIHYLQDAFKDLQSLYGRYGQLKSKIQEQGTFEEALKEIQDFEQEIDLEYLFEDIPSSISQSLDGTTRIRDIVKAMKEFSHPGSSGKEHIDLNHAIESTITVARNEWKYVAEIKTDFADNLPAVEVIPGEFNQVILNMIVNAAHAIADRQAKEDSNQQGNIKVSTERQQDSVQISISDSGCGIPKANLDRIFDPFFTTKEVGKGTGQGLSIAYSVIVDKHDGHVSVDSKEGEGTTFYIKLPIESTEKESTNETPDVKTLVN